MTLKDIAREAGVSPMTVSNVINGRFDHVSKATIDRINALIHKYNYTPNLSARSLSAKNSKIIFLIIPLSHSEQTMFYSPYTASIAGYLEYELRQKGYYAMIRSVYNYSELDALFKNWPAAGAIFLLPDFDSYIDKILANIQLPLVFIDSCFRRKDMLNVICDDEKGTYLSTSYLINLKHTRIAFVGDYRNSPLLTARYNGYCRALFENNLTLNPDYIFEQSPSYENGILIGQKIAASRGTITAVTTTSDYCAAGIMEGARLGGLKLPEELSVVGYDDLPFCTYCAPKLTTIHQNIEEKASAAVNLLLSKIAGSTDIQPLATVDVCLVERQSATFCKKD